MGDGFDQEDPFKKYGGSELKQEDPFKKYGGVAIAEHIKKKVSLPKWLQPSTNTGLSGGLVSGAKKVGEKVERDFFQEGEANVEEDIDKQKRDESFQLLTSESFKKDPIKEGMRYVVGQSVMDAAKPKTESVKQEFIPEELEVNEPKINQFNVGSTQKKLIQELLPDAKTARQWLSEKQNPEADNTTDKIATEILQDNQRIKDALVESNGDIGAAALKYYGSQDPQVNAILKEGKTPPAETIERLKWNFLNDPLVKEAVDENIPITIGEKGLSEGFFKQFDGRNIKDIYDEEKANFRLRNPLQWTNSIVSQIAQGREDYGENNPFINLTGVASSDRVVEQLFADGKIDKLDYNKYYDEVRPLIAMRIKKIPTPGLAENTLQSAVHSVSNIPKAITEATGIRNIYTTAGDRAFENLQEDENAIAFKPQSFLNTVGYHSGNLGGFIVPIVGGAKVLQATKLIKNASTANQFMTGLTFYHDLYKANETKNPEGGLVNNLSAAIQSAAFVKLTPFLGKLTAPAIKQATPEIQTILKNLSTEKIGADAAKEQITKTITDKIKDFATKGERVAKQTLGSGVQMFTANMVSEVVSGVFTGKFDLDESLNQSLEAGISMLYGTPLLHMAQGKPHKQTAGKVMFEMTERPEETRATIERLSQQDPEFKKIAPEILENFDRAIEIRKLLDESELKQEQKEKYLVIDTQKKILEDKVKNSPSKALNLKDEKQIAALEIEEQMITDPDMGNKRFIEEMYDGELMPKSDRILLENNETGKFEPNKVGAYLKFIAQQANGLGENWEVLKGGKPKMENYPEQIIEAANERWAKEIEKAQPKAQSPTPEQVEGKEGVIEDLGGKEKGVTSPRYGKATENISAEKDKGTSDSPLTSTEESPEKLSKRYERVTNENDFVDPYDVAIKYFADGGKINPNELERIFGGKGDKGARISLMKNNAGTVKQIAHFLWEADQTGRYEDTHFIDAVESALRDFPSQSAMKKDLADRYDLEGAYEKYKTQERGQEAIDIVERMTEEEINHLLQLDAEKSIDIERYIDDLPKSKKPTVDETPLQEPIQPNEQASKPTAQKEKVGELSIEPVKEAGEGEPPKPPSETKTSIHVERPATELSHKGLQNVANEFSLPDVKTRDRKSDVQLRQDARNTANEWAEKGEYGKKVEGLVKEAESGEVLTDKERVILEGYLANLSFELRNIKDKNSPEFNEKLNEITRLKLAGEKTRSEAGAALRIPGGGSRPHPIVDYADAMVTMKEAVGKDLTPEQKTEVDKMVSEYEQRATVAEQKAAEMETKYAELQAQKGKEKTKKSKTEYKSERDKLRDSIKEKWKSAGQDVLSVDLPFRKQLSAIAPDVAKLVKSYVSEGITEFNEVVKKVHEFIKELNPDIEEKDVVNLLAGKYNEVKETKTDLVRKLKGIKDKNSAEAIKIRARIRSGDFAKKELPKTWVMDAELKSKYPKEYKEAIDALEAKEQAKLDFDIAVYKQELAKRSAGKKGIDFVRALIATTKAVKSGIDDSAVMMQNIVAMVSHPRSAVKAFKEHALDAISEKRFRRYLTELHNSPIWDLIQKSGLDITDPKSLKEQNKEEIFDNNLLNKDFKIGGKKFNIGKYVTRPFERAFTSLGNAMRVNMFTRIAERMMEEGKTFETHPEEFKSLASVLNTETGRGKLHTQIERASQLVTAGIWSPRLMSSRINMLGISELSPLFGGKGYYAGLTPTMRKMAIADMVKFLGAGVSLMAFAGSQGATVDDDPESPTFGTIQVGEKKYNAWGGMTPYAKTVYQGITGHRNIKGERVPVTKGKLIGSFFRSRLTPAAGVTTNLLVGKDFAGKPITAGGELENLILPLSIMSIKDAVEKDGMTGILTQGIPSFIGIGVSDQRDFQKKEDTTHEPQKPSKPKVQKPEIKRPQR